MGIVSTAALAVTKLLLIMLVGAVCSKLGILTMERTETLSVVMTKMLAPFLIVSSFFKEYDVEHSKGFLMCMLFSLIVALYQVILPSIFIRKKTHPEWQLERVNCALGGVGTIGIPIISFILGQEGIFYMTGFMTMCSIQSWVYGPLTMSGRFSKKDLIKSFFVPANCALYIGMAIYFLRIKLPEVVTASITSLGNCMTPIALLIAGSILVRTNLKDLLTNANNYYVYLLKLIISPLLVLPLIKLLNCSPVVGFSCYIAAASPISPIVTSFALQENKNPERASGLFAISVVLCMPCVVLLTYIFQLFYQI